MSHGPLVWGPTIALVVAMLLFDYFVHIRRPHVPTIAEASRWSAAYVGIALLFGGAVWAFGGANLGIQYFAGYLTEKALSTDNVFVFLLILSSFKVPREDQQKALLIGIAIALLARSGFIFAGAALIEHFAWVFYLFGILLLIAAGHMLTPRTQRHGQGDDTVVLRLARTLLPTTGTYDGDKLFTVQDGRRRMTPMVAVIAALGFTDVLFALDSIPAIFGLTEDVFIVFSATAFSLLGLRQLFFLIEGLLERLLYLSVGLAAILALIGVKLVLHALHDNSVPFINGGEGVHVLEITPLQSLVIIVAILAVTVLASLVSPKGKAKTAVSRLRQAIQAWQDLSAAGAPDADRTAAYAQVAAAEDAVRALPQKYRALIRQPQTLREMLADVHARHAAETQERPADLRAGIESEGDQLASKLNWLRAGVMGANDGIVSTAGLVVGVAGAAVSEQVLLVSGAASVVAGAISMAVGEYVSVCSQRDSQRAEIEHERKQLAANPAYGLDQLARLIQSQGIAEPLAREVARQLSARDALSAHARLELNIDPHSLANPWAAALASMLAFVTGGVIPFTAIALAPREFAVPVTATAVTTALTITGVLSAHLGHAPALRAALRTIGGGLLAMGVTYGVGALIAAYS